MKQKTFYSILILFFALSSSMLIAEDTEQIDSQKVAQLIKLLGDDRLSVRKNATKRLCELDHVHVLLKEASNSTNNEVNSRAKYIIQYIGLTKKYPLTTALFSEHGDNLHRVIISGNAKDIWEFVFEMIKTQKSLDSLDKKSLIAILHDTGISDFSTQEKTRIIHFCTQNKVPDIVVFFLKDKDYLIRNLAVSVLGSTGNHDYAKYIVHLLKDPEIQVCDSAVSSLANLKATEYVKDIILLSGIPHDVKNLPQRILRCV